MATKQIDSVVVSIPSRELTAALRRLKPITKDNPIVPAYSSVLIEAFCDGDMMLTAGSDYQRMTITISGCLFDSDEPVITFAPELKTLLDTMNVTPDGLVWMSEKQGGIRLESGVSKVDIPAIPPTDYPHMGVDKLTQTGELTTAQTAELGAALRRCVRFMGKNDLKPQLDGVWIKPVNGILTLEATDEILATIMSTTIDSSLAAEPVLIPHYSVEGMVASLETGKTATLFLSPKWLGINSDDTAFHCRRMDVQPLNMAAMFPVLDQLDCAWTEDRAVLIGLLKRITALPGMPIKLAGNATSTVHTAKLTSQQLSYNSSMGDYQIEQPIEGWSGPELGWGCGVRCQALIALINSLPDNDIALHLDSTGKRRMIYCEGANHRSLLMSNFL